MSGTRSISTTSRHELSSSFFSCKVSRRRKFTPFWRTLACFLPGRAKNLSAPLYATLHKISLSPLSYYAMQHLRLATKFSKNSNYKFTNSLQNYLLRKKFLGRCSRWKTLRPAYRAYNLFHFSRCRIVTELKACKASQKVDSPKIIQKYFRIQRDIPCLAWAVIGTRTCKRVNCIKFFVNCSKNYVWPVCELHFAI